MKAYHWWCDDDWLPPIASTGSALLLPNPPSTTATEILGVRKTKREIIKLQHSSGSSQTWPLPCNLVHVILDKLPSGPTVLDYQTRLYFHPPLNLYIPPTQSGKLVFKHFPTGRYQRDAPLAKLHRLGTFHPWEISPTGSFRRLQWPILVLGFEHGQPSCKPCRYRSFTSNVVNTAQSRPWVSSFRSRLQPSATSQYGRSRSSSTRNGPGAWLKSSSATAYGASASSIESSNIRTASASELWPGQFLYQVSIAIGHQPCVEREQSTHPALQSFGRRRDEFVATRPEYFYCHFCIPGGILVSAIVAKPELVYLRFPFPSFLGPQFHWHLSATTKCALPHVWISRSKQRQSPAYERRYGTTIWT